jgi:hypothetical protein
VNNELERCGKRRSWHLLRHFLGICTKELKKFRIPQSGERFCGSRIDFRPYRRRRRRRSKISKPSNSILGPEFIKGLAKILVFRN